MSYPRVGCLMILPARLSKPRSRETNDTSLGTARQDNHCNRVFQCFLSVALFISATCLAKLRILNFGWPLKKGKDDRKPLKKGGPSAKIEASE